MDLLKATEDLKEYSKLKNAVDKLKETAELINKQKKQKENMQLLKKIHRECGIKEIPESRQFIYEDIVYKQQVPQKQTEKEEIKYFFRIYLFSDEVWLVKYKLNVFQKVKKFPVTNIHFTTNLSQGDTAFKLGKTTYYTTKSLKLTNLQTQFVNLLPHRDIRKSE